MDKPGTGDLSEREGGGKGEEKNNQRKKGSPASPLQQWTDKNHQAARDLLEEEGESLRRNSADLTARRGWLVTPVTRRGSPGPAQHAVRAHGEMGRREGCLVSGGGTQEGRRGLQASHTHSHPHSPPPHTPTQIPTHIPPSHTLTAPLHPHTHPPQPHTHTLSPHTHSLTHIPPHIPHILTQPPHTPTPTPPHSHPHKYPPTPHITHTPHTHTHPTYTLTLPYSHPHKHPLTHIPPHIPHSALPTLTFTLTPTSHTHTPTPPPPTHPAHIHIPHTHTHITTDAGPLSSPSLGPSVSRITQDAPDTQPRTHTRHRGVTPTQSRTNPAPGRVFFHGSGH